MLEFSSIIFTSYALISAVEINISILRWITGRIKKTYGKKNLYSWHEILRFQNLISHSFHSNLHQFLITIFFKTLTLKNNHSPSFAPVEIIGQLLSIPCWLQHDTPLHAPHIGVDWRLFFWQLQLLFDAQSLLQLHLISLSSSGGTGTLDNKTPFQRCTWWNTRKEWNLAASDVGGRFSGIFWDSFDKCPYTGCPKKNDKILKLNFFYFKSLWEISNLVFL